MTPHVADQGTGARGKAIQRVAVQMRCIQQPLDDFCFVAPVPLGDFAAQAVALGQGFVEYHLSIVRFAEARLSQTPPTSDPAVANAIP